jgi:hypothetical protein
MPPYQQDVRRAGGKRWLNDSLIDFYFRPGTNCTDGANGHQFSSMATNGRHQIPMKFIGLRAVVACLQLLQLRAQRLQREFFFAPTVLQKAVLDSRPRCARAAFRWCKVPSLWLSLAHPRFSTLA